jgi:hypothetical protein
MLGFLARGRFGDTIMTEFWEAGVVMLLLLGSSATGLYLRPLLPERHRSAETADLVRLVGTMLVTFAALVLGLLTTSAKDSFDLVNTDIRRFSVDIIQLDRNLREFGDETQAERTLLRRYTAAAIASTWTEEPPPEGDYYPKDPTRRASDAELENSGLGDMLDQIEAELRHLDPPDAMRRKLLTEGIARFDQLTQRRWKLIGEAQDAISWQFFGVLTLWLMVIFACFGISSPRNPLVVIMLGLGAFSIASAVFVILDLGTPFGGFFAVSSEPLREALVHLSR